MRGEFRTCLGALNVNDRRCERVPVNHWVPYLPRFLAYHIVIISFIHTRHTFTNALDKDIFTALDIIFFLFKYVARSQAIEFEDMITFHISNIYIF